MIIAAIAAMGVSCAINEPEEKVVPGDSQEFYATLEDASTRVFADEKLRVRWDADDRVSIFNKYTFNREYYFAGATGDNAGVFRKVESEDFMTGNALDYVYAVYPYNEANRIDDDGAISISLPVEQVYREDSFGRGANTMVSVTEDNELLFKNLCGYLVLKLYGNDVSVSSLVLRGNSGEKISGAATVSAILGATPSVETAAGALDSIKLNCQTAVTIGTSSDNYTEFWLVVPPLTFTKGFTLTVTDPQGGIFTKQTTKPVTIARNSVSRMAAIEVELEQHSNIISFADANVKAALLAKGIDTDGDGEISYSEAAAVNSVEKDFLGNYKNKVSSFDEFQYFTSVTKIGDSAFQDCSFKSIVLPGSVTVLGECAFVRCRKLEGIRLPDNITSIGYGAFLACDSLVDVVLPANLKATGQSMFYNCPFTHIELPEGLTTIDGWTFSECANLEEIYLPDNLKVIGPQAFEGCVSLSSVSGGRGLQELGFRSFEKCTSLKTFHIPDNVTTIGDGVFFESTNLERFTGKYVAEDGRAVVKDGTLIAMAFAGMTNITYEVPANVTSIGGYVFSDCYELSSISLHDKVVSLGDCAFLRCTGLKSITLPSSIQTIGGGCFDSCTALEYLDFPEGMMLFEAQMCYGCTELKKVQIPSTVTKFYNNVFTNCTSLEEVVCKAITPPALRSSKFTNYDKPQDSFTNTPETMRICVPSSVVDLYKQTETWSDHAAQIEGVVFPDMDNPNFYISSDYSQDGTVFTIQSATEGNGINIVIMGDCFVDTDIADGSYRAALEHAIDVFFEVEPYASFRHLFNVYGVNVVSPTEGYAYSQGKLSTWFGSGTAVGGSDSVVQKYAQKAVSSSDLGVTLIIVMMNRAYYAGTCYMYYSRTGDYGQGLSIAYFPLGTSDAMFAGLIQHEAGGHGFAKLADEYNYSSAITESQLSSYHSMEPYGWWKNVDFTPDPSAVKWSAFLNDSRYASEKLGVYEGACTYANGAYRPSEQSIMRHNTGGFNAPSREAIYYRIHKLAYGDSWQYDREAFVQYDLAKNVGANAMARSSADRSHVFDNLPPLAPPVVIIED